jgi:endonuclease YncB( thermonuclease family)
MVQRSLQRVSSPSTFAELLRAVLAVLLHGRAEVEQAWVRTYHEIGRLINVYVLANRERAGYGGGVFDRLAERTGMSVRTLRECSQFQRCFPIWRKSAKLGWSHYVLICQVGDPALRQKLLREAQHADWKVDELRARVRGINAAIDIEATPVEEKRAAPAPARARLVPQRGRPGVHRLATVAGRRVVDLGFACYLDLTAEQAAAYPDGALVQWDDSGRLTAAVDATRADLFTYRAEVLRVVDGDTLWVRIYLRPGHWVKQKLRLRGLDAPELGTTEGKAAKRFTDGLVSQAAAVVINTTRADKYDRYLADVFLQRGSAPELFLNQALLDNGHAVRKEAWEFRDWEPELGR